jgi:hypothetical protein
MHTQATQFTSKTLAALLSLSLSCCGGGGGDDGASAAPPAVPAIQAFSASTLAVQRDEQVTLTAAFEGGVGTVTPGVGAVAPGAPVHVNPTGDTSYRLTVTGSDGTAVDRTVVVLEFDHVVTSVADAGPGSLRQAMIDAMNAGGGEIGIVAGPIVLETPLPTIDASLRISGVTGGEIVDGADLHRIFFKDGSTTLEITDLTLRNGRAQGGDGGRSNGGGGGGGAAGLGGALFVNDGVVVLARVRCETNTALGGIGGDHGSTGAGGGGGGIGGSGADPSGDTGGTGGSGGPLGGPGGGPGVAGGEGAGGGGANLGGTPGNGGFGGGGGGGQGFGDGGAAGGFGGGGGGGGNGDPGGPGGFGGGAGGSGAGQYGGGGGGAGFGGAIFVRAGFLQLTDVAFVGNHATGTRGGIGGAGQTGESGRGKGGAVFVNLGAVAFGTGVTFMGNAASDHAAAAGDDENVFGLLDLN